MKKVLLSTALLSTFALAAISVDAEEVAKTEGKASVTFKKEGGVTDPDKPGYRNIVIGKVPEEMVFKDAKVQASGAQSVGLKANASAEKWIMINDDRPLEGSEAAKGSTVKMGPWNLKVKMSALKDENSSDTIAAALNYTFIKGLQRYNASETGEPINTGNGFTYDFKDPSATNVSPYTMGDTVKYATALDGLSDTTPKTVTLQADGAAVTLLSRTGNELDPNNAGKLDKGGQGYLLTFNNPVLDIKEPVKDDLAKKTYSADISYILDDTP